jgi:hypothetical protein
MHGVEAFTENYPIYDGNLDMEEAWYRESELAGIDSPGKRASNLIKSNKILYVLCLKVKIHHFKLDLLAFYIPNANAVSNQPCSVSYLAPCCKNA